MAWFDWLTAWFRPRASQRNVSKLAGLESDTTREVIDTSGGPLKPNQLRRSLRDRRLLPKARPSVNSVWPLAKKPTIIPADEANRLFSETLRTRNRNIRDLATDTEQLARYGLPEWTCEADVANALGLTLGQLRHFSIHRDRETTPHYVTFAIPKRSGGHRLIQAPKKRLKAIQRTLNTELVSKLPVSAWAHGFRSGRSIASNAKPHVGKALLVKLDIQDCFPSLHYGRVRGLLIAMGYSYPVATCLAVLMTEAPRQPVAAEGRTYHVPIGPRVCVQGAPTSPGLCNAILMRLDRRLAGLAQLHGFQYTRYADDMTFSGDDASQAVALTRSAKWIVRDEGFRVNPSKTRWQRRGRRQLVTGVTVNEEMGLSRKARRRLRARIHQHDKNDLEGTRRLKGEVAYLAMLNPKQAEPLQQQLKAVLE